MLLNGSRDDVHVSLKPRACVLMRLAVTTAAIEREILRQHVQQHAVAFEQHVTGPVGGVAEILGGELAGMAEFVQAAALRTEDVPASDAQGHGLGRDARAALRVSHGCAHRLRYSQLIHDASFVPASRGGKPVRQIADAVALQRAEHATGARTTGVEPGGDLDLRAHYFTILTSPP